MSQQIQLLILLLTLEYVPGSVQVACIHAFLPVKSFALIALQQVEAGLISRGSFHDHVLSFHQSGLTADAVGDQLWLSWDDDSTRSRVILTQLRYAHLHVSASQSCHGVLSDLDLSHIEVSLLLETDLFEALELVKHWILVSEPLVLTSR